jgi:hypothetical protein
MLCPCTLAVTSSVPLPSQASASSGAVCARQCATTPRLTTSRTMTVPTTPASPPPSAPKLAAGAMLLSPPRGDSLRGNHHPPLVLQGSVCMIAAQEHMPPKPDYTSSRLLLSYICDSATAP